MNLECKITLENKTFDGDLIERRYSVVFFIKSMMFGHPVESYILVIYVL